MHVAGRHHPLIKLLSQFDDLPVQFPQVFFRVDIFMLRSVNHKGVVPNRLHFQVIIERNQFGNFFFRPFLFDRLKEFSCATGATDDQSLSVLFQHAFGYERISVEILQMRLRYQRIEVHPPLRVLGKQDTVVGS